jgi:uncharacterized small protein (DUF1192 family)
MAMDEDLPKRADDPVTMLTRQDLDPMSVDELHERISLLETEINRVRAKIDKSVNHKASAEALFRK